MNVLDCLLMMNVICVGRKETFGFYVDPNAFDESVTILVWDHG